jgi:hypothetical protein
MANNLSIQSFADFDADIPCKWYDGRALIDEDVPATCDTCSWRDPFGKCDAEEHYADP